MRSGAARTVRIGDRERDHAVDCLREHVAAGRLDEAEFEQRMETALTARYAADLVPLFVDLPAPRPDLPTARPERESAPTIAPDLRTSVDRAKQPSRNPAVVGWGAATTILWAVAIVACVASGWHLWWLLFIPLVMGGGCGHHQRRAMRDRRTRARMHRLDHRSW